MTHCREVVSDQNLRGGKPWVVYIDDFRQNEEYAEEEMTTLPPTRSDELIRLLDFYKDNGMAGTLEASRSLGLAQLGKYSGGLRRWTPLVLSPSGIPVEVSCGLSKSRELRLQPAWLTAPRHAESPREGSPLPAWMELDSRGRQ